MKNLLALSIITSFGIYSCEYKLEVIPDEIVCPEFFEDERNGQFYSAAAFGKQCWMTENLNIGNKISVDDCPDSNNGQDEIEKYCSDNDPTCEEFGGLYTWGEMMNYPSDLKKTNDSLTRGICPLGWHVPTDLEWQELEIFSGMDSIEAKSYGERGVDAGIGTKWKDDEFSVPFNEPITPNNYSKYYTPDTGEIDCPGVFAGSHIYYWTATTQLKTVKDAAVAGMPLWRHINNMDGVVRQGSRGQNVGKHVRCVKD